MFVQKLLAKNKAHKAKGFTLVELIITLLIGSLLLAWGVPNYRDLKVRRQLTDTANEIVYSLSLARAEAVRYGATVTVEPTGGDWNDGWLISAPGIDGNPDIQIYQQDALNDQMTINQLGPLVGDIQFNSLGALNNVSEGLFQLSSTTSSESRNIRIRLTGLARVVN